MRKAGRFLLQVQKRLHTWRREMQMIHTHVQYEVRRYTTHNMMTRKYLHVKKEKRKKHMFNAIYIEINFFMHYYASSYICMIF